MRLFEKLYKYDNESLTFKKTSFWRGFIFLFVCGLAFGYGTLLGFKHTQVITLEQEELVVLISNQEKKNFKPDSVYSYLMELKAPFPHILYAQAIIESGNFKSDLFRSNNNCYGMKNPNRRVTTSIGDQYGYAMYRSWKDCVIDRCFYNSLYLGDIETENQYYEYLSKSGYAEDPNYIIKVRELASKIKNDKSTKNPSK